MKAPYTIRPAVVSMTYACIVLLGSLEDISMWMCDPTMIARANRIAQVCIVLGLDN